MHSPSLTPRALYFRRQYRRRHLWRPILIVLATICFTVLLALAGYGLCLCV